MASTVAKLCSKCSSKKSHCVKCGKWASPSSAKPAIVCQRCGTGSKKDACISCGSRASTGSVMAILCAQCSAGSKAGTCVVCGRKA